MAYNRPYDPDALPRHVVSSQPNQFHPCANILSRFAEPEPVRGTHLRAPRHRLLTNERRNPDRRRHNRTAKPATKGHLPREKPTLIRLPRRRNRTDRRLLPSSTSTSTSNSMCRELLVLRRRRRRTPPRGLIQRCCLCSGPSTKKVGGGRHLCAEIANTRFCQVSDS